MSGVGLEPHTAGDQHPEWEYGAVESQLGHPVNFINILIGNTGQQKSQLGHPINFINILNENTGQYKLNWDTPLISLTS